MRIGEMPWTEVREAIQRGAAALVPLGSIEEHGPHSPMGDSSVLASTRRRICPT